MIVNTNGIDIYYEKVGNGQPIILLHGNSEDHTKFGNLASVLSSDHTVYSLDSRCHGKSSSTDTIGYKQMMEDVVSFITELHIEKPIIVGFSDGAITGLMIALNYPDLLAALISCGANTQPSQLKKWFLAFAKAGYFITRDPKLKMMYSEPDIKQEDLKKIKIPVLVLAGSRDIVPRSVTEEIAGSIPGSRVKIIDGETHSSYIEHNEKLQEQICPFLKELK